METKEKNNEQEAVIKISHLSKSSLNYFDDKEVKVGITSVACCSILISRFAAILQEADDKDRNCDFEIIVRRTLYKN